MSSKYWQEPFDVKDLKIHSDERGYLFEILRFIDNKIPGKGQLYTFSINPGKRRGDHYHLKKEEWFTCVYGKAIILLKSQDGKMLKEELSSENPKIFYAGNGTSHALINNENTPAVIVSYGSIQHDPLDEDTYHKLAD